MLLYIIDTIINHCCFGKPKKEIKFIHRIKEDVLEPKEEIKLIHRIGRRCSRT